MTDVEVHSIRIDRDAELTLDDVLPLYDAVGWSAYTDEPETLLAGLRGSSFVAAAWDHDELVGLARVVSDDATIMYLQDILVAPSHHRRGVGRALAETVLDRYRHVRQKVLLTDDDPAQKAFYESLGFLEVGSAAADQLRSFALLG